MLTAKEIKYYASLLQKKYRKSEKKFLVEGIKLVTEAINSNCNCEIVLSSQSFYDDNRKFFVSSNMKKIRIEILRSHELEKLGDTKTPQGVIAVFDFKPQLKDDFGSDKLIVALENVSDPGNMGTILRNCDWFGVKNVLLSLDCAEIYNPKVIRASAGSVFYLNIFEEENFYSKIEEQKKLGHKILCADLNGENLYSLKKNERTILVLANEANGPSSKILELSDKVVTIPPKGKAESLNVACASAVILSELTK